ncbi:hypothetical protein [Leptolyngbya ohadii]|uniref:hypothetical protein n=1 Tax=Leptolyngbya ohadii TaxID=1962290 RepID=UPI000B59ABAB|nr:hypothetical protein [Leptolyngbya ohadii]
MDGWQQDWLRSLESVTKEVEQFFENVGRDLAELADVVIDLSEEIVEEVERSIAPKLDQLDHQIVEWLKPVVQLMLGVETSIDRAVEPVTHTVEPWLNQHPICIGCQHYHGQVYGGNLLVCAMHPFGVDEGVDSCPDKELVSWSFSSGKSQNSESGDRFQ